MAEYPTDEQLERIGKFDFLKEGVLPLLSLIEDVWHWPEWGFKLTGKKVLKLELHTGGWSGNEEVIAALERNEMFFACFWIRSKRGGHYYFRIGPSFIIEPKSREK